MSDTFTHDPNATLDYAVDWSAWLVDDDAISSIDVAVEAGSVTVESDPAPSHTGGVVTAWLSGGTVGEESTVRFRITTTDGRTDDRSIYLTIRER